MKTLVEVCLLTDDVLALTAFYSRLLQAEPVAAGEVHAGFQWGGMFLSFYQAREMEAWAPGSTRELGQGGVILGFEVEDVDAEWARVQALGVTLLREPTTFPWGRRAVWFADPWGHKITFSAPV